MYLLKGLHLFIITSALFKHLLYFFYVHFTSDHEAATAVHVPVNRKIRVSCVKRMTATCKCTSSPVLSVFLHCTGSYLQIKQ